MLVRVLRRCRPRNIKYLRACGFLALAFVMIGSVAYAQKVNVDADWSAPFATYTTYAWTVGTPAPTSLGDDRVRAAVDGQLAGKGLTQVMDAPNVFVATHVLTAPQQELVANGFGPWAFRHDTVAPYATGTLVVDLYDASTRNLVWRGVAASTASNGPSPSPAKIEKALAKMFLKYPPSAVPSR